MSNIHKKPIYEKPIIRDLTAFSAKGQTAPDGFCGAGPTPYYSCNNGSAFIGACDVGTTPDTSKCEQGGMHTAAACRQGGYASTTCFSGSGQNF